ncbi:MAG TPA: glycine betaine ABC transporter substrate-binding protein [Thermomicrobiales bacterium]|nr:glycine betaine ABC transporter substrate-binding protein [Thermomicrobiales bacterium]
MLNRRTVLKGAIATPFAATALAAAQPATFAQDDPVVVGSKDFTEQFILGNMYLLVLQDMGLETEDALNLGGTQIAHQALQSGDISTYPEYTGTALVEVLGMSVEEVLASYASATPVAASATPVTSASDAAGGSLEDHVYTIVRDAYQEQFGLTWLAYSPFNNTQALAVKREWSEENGITTISQLAEIAGDLTISAPADFPEREDGLLGLQRVYGAGFEEIETLPVAPGLKYQALLDDEAEVVLAFGTDGQIAGYDLIVLEDDLGLWPPYNVAPIVNSEVLAANPEIEERFNEVTTSLTGEVMSGLNWRVDGDEKAEPADVAREYLEENGFIGG